MAKKKSKASLKKLNETGKRSGDDRRKSQDTDTMTERRKTKRRRQIDPTTCEREYNEAEIEFMHALDEYKRASGRMFPTCSEILEVILKLGYRQVADVADNFAFEETDEQSSEELENDLLERELEDQVI